MTLAFSDRLSEIVNPYRRRGGSTELQLRTLAESVVQAFAENRRTAEAFLGKVSGKGTMRQVLQAIVFSVPHDSVVRDLATTGHLAKVLARFDILERTKNYSLVALPHRIFDALSERERTDFFIKNGSHPVDATVLDLPETKELVARESKLFALLASRRRRPVG